MFLETGRLANPILGDLADGDLPQEKMLPLENMCLS